PLPRSVTAPFRHSTACDSPEEGKLQPTTAPCSFSAATMLLEPPGSVPRSRMRPFSHRNACQPSAGLAVVPRPATTLRSLRTDGWTSAPPSDPRSVFVPFSQSHARVFVPYRVDPTTRPCSSTADAAPAPRSRIFPFRQRNACICPDLVLLQPTMSPRSFSSDGDVSRPPSVPRSIIPPVRQTKPRKAPRFVVANPITSPRSLIAIGLAFVVPLSVPRSVVRPRSQRNGW